MTGESHLKKAGWKLKTCEDYTFFRWRGEGISVCLIRFSDRTTNHQRSLLLEAS